MISRPRAPEIIFTMGLPGAGKSSWVALHYPSYHRIDVDDIQQTHPLYTPYAPSLQYPWAKARAQAIFREALRLREGQWVYVGTGANLHNLLRRMTLARSHGYRVGLVFVDCSLTAALQRNASRERSVAETVIYMKDLHIKENFAHAARYADFTIHVDNNGPSIEAARSYTYHYRETTHAAPFIPATREVAL